MKVNTVEMKQIASEIKSLSVEYQTLISGLYSRFANMSTTREWIGNRAKEYVSYAMLDKPEMMSVGKSINAFGKYISDAADIIELTASKARRDEQND